MVRIIHSDGSGFGDLQDTSHHAERRNTQAYGGLNFYPYNSNGHDDIGVLNFVAFDICRDIFSIFAVFFQN